MSNDPSPSSALTAFAEAHLGRIVECRPLSSAHGVTRSWELTGRSGRRAVLKSFGLPVKFMREVGVYRNYLPKLPSATPTMLATRGEPHWAILISIVPGHPLPACELTPDEEQTMYREAGAFLRAMHRLPLAEHDSLPMSEALRQRFDAWAQRASNVLPNEALQTANDRFAVDDLFCDVDRVLCHRDYSPSNWIIERDIDQRARLAVVDFEHARPDARHVDFLKLWDGPWINRPDLEEAFLDGYGEALTDDDRRRIETLAVLHGISTVVWAAEHQDAEFGAHGRAILRRLHILDDQTPNGA